MSIRQVGPIAVNPGNYLARWSGDPNPQGLRPFSISGSMRERDTAAQLLEFVNNPDAAVPTLGERGVLAYIDCYEDCAGFDDTDVSGWALLLSASIERGPQSVDAYTGWGPFTLDALAVGDRRSVVTRYARARSGELIDDDTIVPKSLVVQPLWGEDAAGVDFEISPGGTSFFRDYDPRTDYDPASPSTTNRRLLLREGTVT